MVPTLLLMCALVMLTFISPTFSQAPALTAIGTNLLNISCRAYCVGINGAPYDAAIPSTWDGAYCVNASRTSGGVPYMQVPCSAVYPGWEEALLCTCAPSDQGRDGQGLGWNQVDYASEVPLRVVYGDNGGVPCQHYCVGISGGPWNAELPVAWDGASCTATSDSSISCFDYPGTPVSCTCAPTGAGWNKAPFNSVAPICGTYAECRTVTGDDGSVSCQSYCMGHDGAPWNGELPAEWNGAICAYTSDPNLSCNDVSPVDVTCTCIRSGYGWNIEPWPIGPPLNQGLLSNGNAAAPIFWAPNEVTAVDPSYAVSPPTTVGGGGGSDFLIWSKCTIGVFVNSICYIEGGRREGHAGPTFIQTMVVGYTDGSYYAAGCGKQSQSNSFANCPAGVLRCIYIDVQGGEVLTSFEMTSTDASEVTSSTSLGSFKLTTANTRTGQPQQSVEVGDDKKKSEFVSVNVGSGMICGMTGRAGYLVDSFGLVFLLPIVSANIENAVSYLGDQFAGLDSASSVIFSGTYLCPTPGLRVCTNSVAYQQGATSIATVTETSSYAFAYSQEFQIEYEYEAKPKEKPKPDPGPEPAVNNYNIVNNNYENQVNVIALLGGRKLMQSDDLSSRRDIILPGRMKTNVSASKDKHPSSGNGIVDRRRLGGVKSSFSVTYKTETTDTTAQTFTTKTSAFTTSTFLVNCQCPVGESDRYCLFENSYASQVSWTSSVWTGSLVVYLQGSDKALTFPTSGYSSGQYLSVDIVQKVPITCASTPDEASQSMRRRLISSEVAAKKAKSDKKKNEQVKIKSQPSSRKHHPKKKTPAKKKPTSGSIQPSLLNWKTPFDGMVSPVIIVGGNGGAASESWFDRCNALTFVTRIEVTSKFCVYYKDNPYKDPNDHPLAVVGHIVLTFSDGSKDTIGANAPPSGPKYCPYPESQDTVIDINLQKNERIVSLTMIAQRGFLLGFNLDTEDAYGVHVSHVAGFVTSVEPGDQISYGYNSDSTYQYFPVSVGSGYICGYSARAGSWVDAFGFVFLQWVESSRIAPVSVNLTSHATPQPFKASVSFNNMACNPTLQAKGVGSCTATFSDAVTSETTTTIETTTQVVSQMVEKLTFKLIIGPKGAQGSFGTTSTFDQKWTTSEKLTNTQTTTTVLTPSLTALCMCPSTAMENAYCSFHFDFFSVVSFSPVPWTSTITLVLSTGYEITQPISGTISGTNMVTSSISMTEGPVTCL